MCVCMCVCLILIANNYYDYFLKYLTFKMYDGLNAYHYNMYILHNTIKYKDVILIYNDKC